MMMGKENLFSKKLICSWSYRNEHYSNISLYENEGNDDQLRKSNCLKNVISDSSLMHISTRNGYDHNHSMQKNSVLSNFNCPKYKRRKPSKLFSAKFMALISSMLTLYLAFEFVSVSVFLLSWNINGVSADFSDNCPSDCNCKWANGKREADCTRGGFTTIPTNLDHEIQILRMTHNYVRKLEKNIFHSTGLINLQRIFMNHCHVQVILL